MKMHARLLGLGVVALVVAGGLLALNRGSAAEKENAARDVILKMADALEKDDAAEAKKQAETLKKANVEDIMGLLKLRTKDGLGIGAKAGAITPDGIEAKLIAVGKKAPTAKDLDAQSADLARAAYVMAAIAQAIEDKCPVTAKKADKDPKEWKQWSQEMHDAALALAKAAKSKDAAAVKIAATKANSACNSCHGPFRD